MAVIMPMLLMALMLSLSVWGKPVMEVNDVMDHLKFTVYTRVNQDKGHVVPYNSTGELKASNFDPKKQTTIVVHGWMGNPFIYTWVGHAKDALLRMSEQNVIIVDWGHYAMDPDAVLAAKYARKTGTALGEYVKFLENAVKADRRNMQLAGHSMGGQVISFAAKQLTNPKLPKLFGLDTAEGEFNCSDTADCLNPTDADFVAEIHTMVSRTDKGHIDFWPLHPHVNPLNYIGEHLKGAGYWVESIASNCTFEAYACPDKDSFKHDKCSTTCTKNNCNHMGLRASNPNIPHRVRYFLNVNDHAPYCKK
ncbi:unnamed protein product [Owenia fusiformis]|uniref:Uncharacterized protein n=1 Tax=Owenia fusiformis TaxID=6347 RepID=A0A8J1Y634_OWEFU|nr:unnamed protein product [Owenia fusiformis]